MENNFYEKIEDFLAGKLPAAEAQKMEAARAADPELDAEINWQRAELELAEATIARQIRQQFAELRATDAPQPTANFSKKIWLAAALIVGVAGAFFYFSKISKPEKTPAAEQFLPTENEPAPQPAEPTFEQPKNSPPPAENLKSKPAPPSQPIAKNFRKIGAEAYRQPDFSNIRAAATGENELLAEAIESIENQNFKHAAERLSSVAATSTRARYLLAHCYFLDKKFAAASPIFTDLARSGVQPWAEESEWFELLARLAAGASPDLDFSRKLGKLVGDDGHPFHSEALELAARLKK